MKSAEQTFIPAGRPVGRKQAIALAKAVRVPRHVSNEVCFNLLESLDCPRSLTAYMLLKYGEHEQLVKLDCRPTDYNSLVDFRDAFQATSLLSKCRYLKTGIDTKKVALSKFASFEEQCAQTNRRFRNLEFDPSFKGSNVWLLNAVRSKISKVLGSFDTAKWWSEANWGPGSSQLIKNENTSGSNKFRFENGMTHELYHYLKERDTGPSFEGSWYRSYSNWASRLGMRPLNLSTGNVVTTVAKNAKTDRVIAIEPGLNVWFQKGIGRMIRSRLKRVGIDLNTQELNQALASTAHKAGLATVDFSSASDSISTEVVRELLPPDWFSALDACRSHRFSSDSRSFKWAKFSSMGNGFTFELESLIFYAAAACCCEYAGQNSAVISVFGDDVILPTDVLPLFRSFTHFLGFTINLEKSFSQGCFYESCGEYYWNGVSVKPFFHKERITGVFDVYKTANAIRMLAHRRNSFFGCDARLRNAWSILWKLLPRPLRIVGPASLGDVAFIGNFDESHSYTIGDSGLFRSTITIRTLHRVPVSIKSDDWAYMLFKLRSLGDIETNSVADRPAFNRSPRAMFLRGEVSNLGDPCLVQNREILRRLTRITFSEKHIPTWYNLGPWL